MIRRIIEDRLANAARRAAFGLTGSVLLICGIAFLTVAAWIILERLGDALTAAAVIGAVYAGGGLICLGLAARAPRTRRPSAKPAEAPTASPPGWDSLVQAFLTGLETGRQSGSGSGRRPDVRTDDKPPQRPPAEAPPHR